MKRRGFGMVYQRGKVWWVKYHFRGQVYRETSRSSVRMDAIKLLRKRMAEMGTGQLLGPKIDRTTFTDLENIMRLPQAAVSQQLARLRLDGLVNTRREGRVIYYSIAGEEVSSIIASLYRLFCAPVRGSPK